MASINENFYTAKFTFKIGDTWCEASATLVMDALSWNVTVSNVSDQTSLQIQNFTQRGVTIDQVNAKNAWNVATAIMSPLLNKNV